MKRDTAREIAIQLIYSSSFECFNEEEFFTEENFSELSKDCEIYSDLPDANSKEYICRVLKEYSEHSEEINGIISKYSKGRLISRISSTALAALRCAITEILFFEDVPVSASINSALEIDKNYDDEETVAFVNGILGSFVRQELSS